MKVKAFLVALIVALFTAGAVMAQDAPAKSIDPYVSVRVFTGYVINDPAVGDSTTNITHALQGNSRFGVKGKNGKVSGQFELGTGPNLRLLYATYDAGMAKVSIGQNYTPWTKFASQVSVGDCGCIGYGALYDGRRNQLKVDVLGAFVTLVEPESNGGEQTLPMIGVGYKFKNDMLEIQPSVAYQASKDAADESITSYLAALYVKVNIDKFYVAVNGGYGVNIGNMGFNNEVTVVDKFGDEDVTHYQVHGSVGGNFGMFGFNVGVGYAVSSIDVPGAEDDTALTYFVNVPVKIEKNFSVTPEFAVYDLQDDAEDKDTYIGAKFQMDL